MSHVQVGDRSWETPHGLSVDVAYFDDGPGILEISVGAGEDVFNLNIMGLDSLFPKFSVPLVGRPVQRGEEGASFSWGDSDTLLSTGSVAVDIGPSKTVIAIADLDLVITSPTSLGCAVKCDLVHDPKDLGWGQEGGALVLCGDDKLVTPRCSALKAALK